MWQLTREEWISVSRTLDLIAIIGENEANAQENALTKHFAEMDRQAVLEAGNKIEAQRVFNDRMRCAIAAVLWVSEHAADEIRFDVVDAKAGGDAYKESPNDQEHR